MEASGAAGSVLIFEVGWELVGRNSSKVLAKQNDHPLQPSNIFFGGVGKKCPRNISPDHVKYNSPTCFFGWQKRLGGRPDARL